MDYAIQTNALNKSFNGIKAIEGLNLTVTAGSIFGLIGPQWGG